MVDPTRDRVVVNERPLFSVVIPTVGRKHFLSEAIDSVLSQDVKDLEVIVVVDGTTEDLDLPCDPRVRVVRRRTKGGAAAARNSGIENSRGRWIGFVDDDDVMAPGRLALVRDRLGDAAVVICWMARFDDPRNAPVANRVLEGDVSGHILEAPVPSVGTTIVRADAIPRFDPRFLASEDVEWWLRLAQAWPVVTVPAVGYRFREHDGDRVTSHHKRRFNARLELIRTHSAHLKAHPRSLAYQWRRAGGLALTHGDRRQARRSFVRALRASPSLRDLAHLARTVWPPT